MNNGSVVQQDAATLSASNRLPRVAIMAPNANSPPTKM